MHLLATIHNVMFSHAKQIYDTSHLMRISRIVARYKLMKKFHTLKLQINQGVKEYQSWNNDNFHRFS